MFPFVFKVKRTDEVTEALNPKSLRYPPFQGFIYSKADWERVCFLLFLSGGVCQCASSEPDSSRRLPGLISIHHEIVSPAPSTWLGLLLICKLRKESRQHTGWVCHWSPCLLACRSHHYKLKGYRRKQEREVRVGILRVLSLPTKLDLVVSLEQRCLLLCR